MFVEGTSGVLGSTGVRHTYYGVDNDRGGHGSGQAGTIWARPDTSPLEARPAVCYMGRGPVTVKDTKMKLHLDN